MGNEPQYNELLKMIQEAVIGINVTVDHLAEIELSLFELRVSSQLSLMIQKQQLIASGKSKEQVDATLAQAASEIRSLLKSQIEHERKSSRSTERSKGDPDMSGSN